jgi:hypothetical protein
VIFGKLGVSSRIAAVHETVRLGVRLCDSALE